jgi:ParB/RepB/Spo0J family partition protein
MSLKLRPIHVETLDLLHGIAGAAPGATVRAIANDVGRDESNAAKTIKRMRQDGLLGEGLDLTAEGRAIARALGPDGELIAAAPSDVVTLPHDAIEPDPDNERQDFDPDELDALRASILQHGLIQPIVVSPPEQPGGKHRIIAGERRWRAIGMALDEGDTLAGPDRRGVRCLVRGGLTPRARAFLRLSENLQRADLHPLDEGAAYQRLVREPFNIDTDEIADEIGKSQRHVQNRIAVAEKLGDADKARMRLPADDPDRLTWRGALAAIQTHKPKPALFLAPKEIVVLLELAQRAKARPSSNLMFPGHDGWVQPPKSPSGEATISLIQRDLIASAEHDTGAAVLPFAKLLWTPELRTWFDTYTMGNLDAALWKARCAAVTPIMAGELERAGRCATPWLNPDLPPEPDELSPAPPNEAGKVAREAAPPVTEGAQGHTPASDLPDEPVSPPPAGVSMLAPAEPAPPVHPKPPEAALSPSAPSSGLPAAKDILIDLPALTAAQAAAMAEVCAKIAADPQDGPRGAGGAPAYVGTQAFDYYKSGDAQALLAGRLVGIVPDARRTGYLVRLTALGDAWGDAHGGDVAELLNTHATGAPWNTAWLNPPAAPEKASPIGGPTGALIGDSFSQQMARAKQEDAVADGPALAPDETWSATVADCIRLAIVTDTVRMTLKNQLTGVELTVRLTLGEAEALWAELGFATARLKGEA